MPPGLGPLLIYEPVLGLYSLPLSFYVLAYVLNPLSLVLEETEEGLFNLLSTTLLYGVSLLFYLASDSASFEANDLPVSKHICFENIDEGIINALSSN